MIYVRRLLLQAFSTSPLVPLPSPLVLRSSPLVVQLRFEPRLLQHGDDLQDMVMSASFQDEVHFRGLHRQPGERALVMHFLDVGVGLGQAGGNLGQRPRQIA